MNHHGRFLRVVFGRVFQLKAFGQVIVYLYCTQLPATSDSVLYHEVEFRAIESRFAISNLCVEPFFFASVDNGLFAFFPNFVRTNILRGVLRVAQTYLRLKVVEMEDFEYGLDDVHHAQELVLNLFGAAEDVGIVLCKRANAGKSVQLATLFVTVNCAELCDTQGQVFIRAGFPCKYLTVVWAVHGFKHVLFVFFGRMYGLERVFAIVRIVPRSYIEVLTADMWGNYFLITKAFLYFTQHVL